MSGLVVQKEYSARYGLKLAVNDMDVAQQIAEDTYRKLVGRDILWSEIHDIQQLILELRVWIGIVKSGKTCH
ncbi:hypothetical protein [Cellvibrio mixtus]|uniref:hypothetical protein n=1 Tax=Cellvibrio mixtus TaxID=39650 RepID=UPI0005867A04|nr:hypothetical protein [Cellvibrio mixtus]